jgi:hypothetical protein
MCCFFVSYSFYRFSCATSQNCILSPKRQIWEIHLYIVSLSLLTPLYLLHLLYCDKSGRSPQLRPNLKEETFLQPWRGVICCIVKERCLNTTPSVMEYLSQGWHVEYLSFGMYITLNVIELALLCKLISWRCVTVFESGCTHQWHNVLKWYILGDWTPKIRDMWLDIGVYLKQQKHLPWEGLHGYFMD